ncbi:patatin-like protein 2 [Dorcoceras hygrometricum]|uniref:Patatin-like protein 2 n=1 Tax=Dorcoceras hygrometricum TaxID=472368 RepID=A0A2Z7BKW5_9LAMI|nr:patatin-like protein 2 [Dorcoceras hygrometricum]
MNNTAYVSIEYSLQENNDAYFSSYASVQGEQRCLRKPYHWKSICRSGNKESDLLSVTSIFSKSGVPVSTYGKKRFMKYEYRLLNDILAKAITVKAGSFDAVRNEQFLMMTTIQFGLKVNWSKILFGVLKEMVDKTQKKAKGRPFPTSKVLSINTVHSYISMNHTIDARGQSDEPGMAPGEIVKNKSKSKKTSETIGETPVEVITEVVSKKRPTVESDEPVVPKKRRTTKSKASSSKSSLDIVNVAQDVVPLQIVEPTPAATAEKSPLPKRKSKKRRLVLSKDSDDENVEEQESVKDTVAVAVDESTVVKHTDEVDVIIGQVLEETSKLATDEEEQREQHLDEPEWLDESFEDFIETETVDKTEGSKEVSVAKSPEKAVERNQTEEELMSIDDLLMQISDNMMLPSVIPAEVTKIRLGSSIEINEVRDSDCRLGRQNEDKAARVRDKYLRCEVPCFIGREHCDVLSMQIDSDLVIYRTAVLRTFQVVTICRVDKSEVLVVLISPHDSKRH